MLPDIGLKAWDIPVKAGLFSGVCCLVPYLVIPDTLNLASTYEETSLQKLSVSTAYNADSQNLSCIRIT